MELKKTIVGARHTWALRNPEGLLLGRIQCWNGRGPYTLVIAEFDKNDLRTGPISASDFRTLEQAKKELMETFK